MTGGSGGNGISVPLVRFLTTPVSSSTDSSSPSSIRSVSISMTGRPVLIALR